MIEVIDASKCSLCGQGNLCRNEADGDPKGNCWCNDESITFPAELLDQVPAELKRKTCICKSCVLAFQAKTSQDQ